MKQIYQDLILTKTLTTSFVSFYSFRFFLFKTHTSEFKFRADSVHSLSINPNGIYLLKVNKRNTRTRCEICSKLTIKTPERHRWLNVLSNNSTNFCLASLFPFFSQCYLIIHFPSKRKFTNFLFLWKL